MKIYIYYNEEKGQFLETLKLENDSHEWKIINRNPIDPETSIIFVSAISLVFDFENRPENPIEYKRTDNENPPTEFVKRAFVRFTKAIN